MNLNQFEIIDNPNLEPKNLFFVGQSLIAPNFFENGFLVSPKLVKNHPKIVYFPALSYSRDFWENISNPPNIILNQIQNQLDAFPLQKHSPLIKDWKKHAPSFLKELRGFLNPDTLSKISTFKIYISRFGTSGRISSFLNDRQQYDFHITVRSDLPWQNINRHILYAIIYNAQTKKSNHFIGSSNWLTRTSTMTLLSDLTNLGPFLSYPYLKHFTPEQIKISSQYAHQLGLVITPNSDFNKLEKLLNPQETNLLQVLKSRPNEIITFEQAGKAIWGSNYDFKFSLYVLAKVVENLRKKIRHVGINKDLILTYRKKGYLLNI